MTLAWPLVLCDGVITRESALDFRADERRICSSAGASPFGFKGGMLYTDSLETKSRTPKLAP